MWKDENMQVQLKWIMYFCCVGRASGCLCVCEREREKASRRARECVRVHVRESVWMCACACERVREKVRGREEMWVQAASLRIYTSGQNASEHGKKESITPRKKTGANFFPQMGHWLEVPEPEGCLGSRGSSARSGRLFKAWVSLHSR